MNNYLSEYKGKNILITGGAGCISSNLTKALAKDDTARVMTLDKQR
jgi:FlaA1/EpsC-like NDP-sugar epimerase